MFDRYVITSNYEIRACEGRQWQLALALLAEMAFAKVRKDTTT